MKIGVLALQGAFAEHIAVLSRLGVDMVEVRLPEQLEKRRTDYTRGRKHLDY